MTAAIAAPFPYFGGKSRIAAQVWERMGRDCVNFVDPFAGSCAFLLAAPSHITTRTINDADGYIANFWRAVASDSDAVAKWLDWPVIEADLFARHVWLLKQRETLSERLHTDPDYYDAKIAGWWCWGACAWLGSGWCSGEGPWSVENGAIVNIRDGDAGQGVNRQLPHLGDAGQGVNRKLPLLGGAKTGINRQLPHLGDAGRARIDWLISYMRRLAAVLRNTRITCGDWARIVQPSVTTRNGITAVLLDPPYGVGEMDYSAGNNHNGDVAAEVWRWAVENGANPLLRIAVCGYEDGRATPPGWSVMRWKARKGYQTDTANSHSETVWFSPHCLPERAPMLFEQEA